MDKYNRYFRIDSGPLIDKVNNFIEVMDTAREKYIEIIDDVGAEPGYYARDGKLVGFRFKNTPDTKLYKKTQGEGWYPKKNTKYGKDLHKRISAVETSDLGEVVDAHYNHDFSIILGNRIYYRGVSVLRKPEGTVVFLTIPWYDEDIGVLEQYKKDRAAKRASCMTTNALLWEPDSHTKEVLGWEREKEITEYQSGVDKEKSKE